MRHPSCAPVVSRLLFGQGCWLVAAGLLVLALGGCDQSKAPPPPPAPPSVVAEPAKKHVLPGTSVEALAQGLDDWLADPQAARRLANAQARWLEQHDWHRVSQRLRGVLSALWVN